MRDYLTNTNTVKGYRHARRTRTCSEDTDKLGGHGLDHDSARSRQGTARYGRNTKKFQTRNFQRTILKMKK